MINEEYKDDPFFNLMEIISVRRIQILVGFLSFFAVIILGVILMPSSYKATAIINLILPTVPKAGDIPYLSEIRSLKTFVENQREIIKSRFIYEGVVEELGLLEMKQEKNTYSITKLKRKLKKIFVPAGANPLDAAVERLYGKTTFDFKRGSSILKVNAFANSSKEAADIANAVAKIYTNYANNLLFSKSQNAYDYIDAQIDRVSDELNSIQDELSKFKKRENVLSLLSIQNNHEKTENQLNELKNQYEQITVQIERAENPNITNNTVANIYRVNRYDSEIVKNLKGNLESLNNELSKTLKDYTDMHPKVISLKDQIIDLETKLSSEVSLDISDRTKSNLENLKQDQDYLSRQIQILKNKLAKLSNIEFKFSRLLMNVENKETEYFRLKVELENAQILEANEIQGGSIKIVDFAHAYPDNKKKKILLVVGFIVSILFGLGMAFFAEYRDDFFTSREDTEKYLQLPVLATIPHITEKMRKDSKKR